MKFAHISDCHLGGWREPRLQQLNLETFKDAVQRCISKKVDFIIFAGDLFDTALPSTEILENAVEQFRILKENGIKCFIIAGSHDFSVSGKTFLSVIEKAGLCKNIGTIIGEDKNELNLFLEKIAGDEVIFSGFYGRKSGLEQKDLKNIRVDISRYNKNFKILALHTTLTEAKPKNLEMMESISINELPKGFDYYALGHLHLPFQAKQENSLYVYPGPLFPNNFQELEELRRGSFVFVDAGEGDIKIEKEIMSLKDIIVLEIDAENLSPLELTEKVLKEFRNHEKEIKNRIVMLKISGVLKEGKTSEINFDLFTKEIENLEGFILLKNIHSLSTSQFKEINLSESGKSRTVEEIEEDLIKKYFEEKKEKIPFEPKILFELTSSMNFEKQEGQTRPEFENKILQEAIQILNLKKIMNE